MRQWATVEKLEVGDGSLAEVEGVKKGQKPVELWHRSEKEKPNLFPTKAEWSNDSTCYKQNTL